MQAGQHPLALLSRVSENRQFGHVVRLGQRGVVVLGSSNDWRDQDRVRSAEMVDDLFQTAVLEEVHERGR